jgi:hypothetical protein
LLHAVVLLGNVGLVSIPGYRWFLAAQVAFYLAAAMAHLVGQRRAVLLMRVPYTMCLLVWATVIGFVYFVTRHQQVTWDRVAAPSATT